MTLRGSMASGCRRCAKRPFGNCLVRIRHHGKSRRGDFVGDIDRRAQTDTHAFGQHLGVCTGTCGSGGESLICEHLLVLDGPVDIAAFQGTGSNGNVEDLGGALRRGSHRPLLHKGKLVRLAGDTVKPLPLAVDGCFRDTCLLDCADNVVRRFGAGGVRRLGVGGLSLISDVDDSQIGIDVDAALRADG